MPDDIQELPAASLAPTETDCAALPPIEAQLCEEERGRRQRLAEAVATTANKLLPLIALLDAIQPQLTQESVFRTKRKKLRAHFDLVYQELHTERPRRQAVAFAFQALADLVREETQDISKDELKQAAKELVLATLKNAPALINVAHQARSLQ